MRQLLIFVLGAMAVLAACGSSGASGLTGKAWELTAITEKVPAFQGVIPAADQSKYVITFNTDGTFNATADCNQTAGTYKTSGSNGLTITPGPSTLVFCGDASFGDLFVHGLSRAASYAISGDNLTITLDDQGTMAFVPAAALSPAPAATTASSAAAASASVKPSAAPTAKPTAKPTAAPTTKPTTAPGNSPGASAAPGPATGLTGKAWQLTAITEQTPAFQGVIPDAQQANYTIEFASDGTFSAKADCNMVSGTFKTADATAASGDLTIVPGPSTRVACPEGSMGDLYVLGLGNSASYAIASGVLTITLNDQGTLVFK